MYSGLPSALRFCSWKASNSCQSLQHDSTKKRSVSDASVSLSLSLSGGGGGNSDSSGEMLSGFPGFSLEDGLLLLREGVVLPLEHFVHRDRPARGKDPSMTQCQENPQAPRAAGKVQSGAYCSSPVDGMEQRMRMGREREWGIARGFSLSAQPNSAAAAVQYSTVVTQQAAQPADKPTLTNESSVAALGITWLWQESSGVDIFPGNYE